MERNTEPRRRDPAIRSVDRGLSRVDRVVGVYVGGAVLWIVLGAAIAPAVADATGLSLGIVELIKGIGFVLGTGVVLRVALHRWAARLADGAAAEHRVAEDLREIARIRSRFLGNVSHELRTPLTSIVGYAKTIHDRGEHLERHHVRHLSERLVANAERLERLVLDLVDLDRMMRGDERLDLEPVRFDELVQAALARVPHEGYALAVETPAVTCELDRAKAERIVEELVGNVLRHTPRGTHVKVSVARNGTSVCLTVSDDGPGIDPTVHTALFEPFTQGQKAGDSASPGLGIGLALVRRYAELHGGSVSSRTGPGVGTRVDVRFPLDGRSPG